MPMLKRLIRELKKFLSTLLHNMFATIAIGLIGVPVLISWATGTFDILFQTIKSPMPVWATIVLVVLLGLYIYLKTEKSHSRQASVYPVKYFTVDKYKWKATIYGVENFEVDRTPICLKHDLPLVFTSSYYYCPDSTCENKLRNSEHYNYHSTAKSYIDRELRKNKL